MSDANAHDRLSNAASGEVAGDSGPIRAPGFVPSAEVAEYLSGVVGVVEANSFEQHSLWKEAQGEFPRTWKDTGYGYGQTVGMVDDMPVCISLLTAVVDGQKLLFIHDTSQVVDHRLVDAWLDAHMPASAFDGERVNRTDAMNFANVFRRVCVSGHGPVGPTEGSTANPETSNGRPSNSPQSPEGK